MLISNPAKVLMQAQDAPLIVIDTETTGLRPYGGDKLFFVSIGLPSVNGLDVYSWYMRNGMVDFTRTLCGMRKLFVGHNIKFDIHFLQQAGVKFQGKLWDTQVMERLRYNDHMQYSLEACGAREGFPKDDSAKAYMNKHGLFTKDPETGDKLYHFDKLPESILVPYAERDVAVAHRLFQLQRETFRSWDQSNVPINSLVSLEVATTPCLVRMESRGIRVNREFCEAAMQFETTLANEAKQRFAHEAGQPLVDSAKCLTPIFDARGIPYGRTDKGNASFKADVLEPHKGHPIVDAILSHRGALKRNETYFKNFLRMSSSGRIYHSIRQSGCASGRMSANDPNTQNWPTEDTTQYPVRRSFLAEPGCRILSLDWSQQEYRLAADEAGERGLIQRIMAGEDFHTATAAMIGIERQAAKTLNFALLYGAGPKKVAWMLGISEQEARSLIRRYFDALPMIEAYIDNLVNYLRTAPFGYNWIGRRFYLKPDFFYKYPNYRIQGGCADIMRIAMVDMDAFLSASARGNTYLILPIHDEFCLNLDPYDEPLIPEMRQIMKRAFRSKRELELDTSAAIGPNFCDLEAA